MLILLLIDAASLLPCCCKHGAIHAGDLPKDEARGCFSCFSFLLVFVTKKEVSSVAAGGFCQSSL